LASGELYDPKEKIGRADLAELQLERLRWTVAQAAHSPFYSKRLEELGLGPDAIQTREDLRRFPLTEKQHLRDSYPYGLLAVPKDRVVRLHHSSGTTGMAIAVFHTSGDVERWAHLVARCLHMAGLRSGDVFQNMMSYGLFTGGLGLHYGAEKLGAFVIPIGAGNSRRQIEFMRIFGGDARSPARGLGCQLLQLLWALRDVRAGRGLRVSRAAGAARVGGRLFRRAAGP